MSHKITVGLTLLFVGSFLFPVLSFAQQGESELTAEFRLYATSGEKTVREDIFFGLLDIGDWWGLWGQLSFIESNDEVYVGPSLAFNPFQLGIALGKESDYSGSRIRYAAFASADFGKLFFFTQFESSPDRNLWYSAIATLQIHEILGLGALWEEGIGLGPRVDLGIPLRKVPVRLWVTYPLLYRSDPIVFVLAATVTI